MSTKSTFITIREAARRLGVHENTIRRYLDRGLINARRLPSGVRRLRRADVDALERRALGKAGSEAAFGRSVEELISETGAGPVSDVTALARPELWGSDDEVEDFIALTLSERERDR